MLRNSPSSLLVLALVLTAAASARADEPVLQVAGALPKTGSLKLSDLEAMKPITVTWAVRERHEVYGVPLDRILTRFGFDQGPMGKDVPVRDKRKGWKMAVRASAPDGFEAVLSCAEVMESMGATRAMVAWKIDGKPLAGEQGPLRLVVLTDKEPSRSVHGLRKLEVLDLRSPPGR